MSTRITKAKANKRMKQTNRSSKDKLNTRKCLKNKINNFKNIKVNEKVIF